MDNNLIGLKSIYSIFNKTGFKHSTFTFFITAQFDGTMHDDLDFIICMGDIDERRST